MPLSHYALDRFVAPHLSELSTCGANDMSQYRDRYDSWMQDFVLNSILRIKFRHPDRTYIACFLRRTQMAFHEYEQARCSLEEYVATRATSKCLLALSRFENCVGQIYKAHMLLKNVLAEKRLFEKDDRSPLDRLNKIYNAGKHAESVIASGELPESFTTPVWITNQGLSSIPASVTFVELEAMLSDLSKCAGHLSNPPVPSPAVEAASSVLYD